MVPPLETAQAYASVLRLADCAGGVTDAQISTAESALGVTFPPAYREFLKERGAALFEGGEIAGLIPPERDEGPDAAPYWQDVVNLNLSRWRYVPRADEERALVVISNDGADYVFLLDTNPAAAERVLALGPGVEYKVVADDFRTFVTRLAKGELEY